MVKLLQRLFVQCLYRDAKTVWVVTITSTFRFFSHYGLDVIARCAFGTVLDSHTEEHNEFVAKATKAFNADISGLRLVIGEKNILYQLVPS